MDVDNSKLTDFDGWIVLVKEVEPLFGPMADNVDFQEALRQSISNNTAFCNGGLNPAGIPTVIMQRSR